MQFCNTMINFDLPWNPLQIEQRIGRIHRIGQTREVFIFNLANRSSLEEYMLSVAEHVRLRFSPQERNGSAAAPTEGQLLTYGSPVLEKVLSLLTDKGTVAAVELQGLHLKQAAPGPEIERLFQPLNARGKFVSAGVAAVPYGIFNFRYTAVSDEKTEGLVSVALNGRSLAEVSGVAHRWHEVEWRERSQEEGPLASAHPVEAVYQRACRGENTFAFSLCDEKLHVTCAPCSRPCSLCGRRFCSACHSQGCPACASVKQVKQKQERGRNR